MDQAPVTTPKPFVFVLMPFGDAFTDIYKYGIKAVAQEANAYAERVDEQLFDGGILDRIYNQISRADVIVADMTGRNPNVFYETGYAHALGKVVLLLTQRVQDIPFDLKNYPHIVYGGSIERLREPLKQRLEWALARARSGVAQQPSLSVEARQVTLVEGASGDTIPRIPYVTQKRTFRLTLYLRNRLTVETPTITHIYLFTSDKRHIVPCDPSKLDEVEIQSLTEDSTIADRAKKAGVLTPFTLSPEEALDGLTKQYRIDRLLTPLPPGAIERLVIPCFIRSKATATAEPMRLRIHVGSSTYDFPFMAQVRIRDKKPLMRRQRS